MAAQMANWNRLLAQTKEMVEAAEEGDWDGLAALQLDRDQIITTLPPAESSDVGLLQEILILNQTLTDLTTNQREELAGSLRQGQKNRQGINAYQDVTVRTH